MRNFLLLCIFLLTSCGNNGNYGLSTSIQIYSKFPKIKNSLLYSIYYEDGIINYNFYIESDNVLSTVIYDSGEYENPLDEDITNNIAENIKKCNIKLEDISTSPIDAIRLSDENPSENTASFLVGYDCTKRWDIYNRTNDTMKIYSF